MTKGGKRSGRWFEQINMWPLTEQNVWLALDISDRAYVIDKGAIVYEGSAETLKEEKGVLCEYLGV